MVVPFSKLSMTSGQMYELRQTDAVFPKVSAVVLIAATIFRFRDEDFSDSWVPAFANAQAHIRVPAQVRKSFALNDSPITSFMYSLMCLRLMSTNSPSSVSYLKTSVSRHLSRVLRTLATWRSRNSRYWRTPDFPGKSNRTKSPCTDTWLGLSVANP